MVAIARRSHRIPVSRVATLATANDLDGTQDNTQAFDVTGAARVIIIQVSNGTDGTAGRDCIEQSVDGGRSWVACPSLMAADADDATGDVVASALLNAAGTEPTGAAVFKAGPFNGQAALRCGRKTTDTGGTTWVTGAPSVLMYAIGKTTGQLTALA